MPGIRMGSVIGDQVSDGAVGNVAQSRELSRARIANAAGSPSRVGTVEIATSAGSEK
jgi:hypothetical protein